MLKDLIAIVDNAEMSADFLKRAVKFSEAQDAHLAVTLLSVEYANLVALSAYGVFPAFNEDFSIDQQEGLEAVRRLTANVSIPVEVRGILGAANYLGGTSRVEGRYADLLLIGDPASFDEPRLRGRLIETALMSSGGPALVLPESASLQRVRRAVVGWDASAEARRAIRDLMTILNPGGHIDIVTVDAEESRTGHGQEPGAAIARHLARHGFDVEVHHKSSVGGRAISGFLESFALDCGADVLAIGAFAHPRVRDILLGGVTRELLRACRVPLLLSR